MRAPWRAWDALRLAVASLGAHRRRSLLSTLGIVVGVASAITAVGLAKGQEAQVRGEVDRISHRALFLSGDRGPSRGHRPRPVPLDAQTLAEVRQRVPALETASPWVSLDGPFEVRFGRRRRSLASVNAIDENLLPLAGMDLAHGRNFTAADRITQAPVAILGASLAGHLGLSAASLGRTFTVDGHTLELVGILKPMFSAFSGGDDEPEEDADTMEQGEDGGCIVPFGSLRGLARPGVYAQPSWSLCVAEGVPLAEAERQVREALRSLRGLRGSDPDDFVLRGNQDAARRAAAVTRPLLLGGVALLAVSLLVGGLGVMNIMLASVTERTREIGLRRAVGAPRRSIQTQLLLEAALLCLVGGTAGLAIGLLLGAGLGLALFGHPGLPPWWALASALLVPLGLGLAFGLYPARAAGRLDPIEALRQE